MPAQRLEIRIPAVKLLIATLVLIMPICVAALLALAQADKSGRRAVGNHFKVIAEISAAEVSQFIHDRVTDVAVIARESSITEAVAGATASYAGKSETQIAEPIQRIENSWNTPASEPLVQKLLSSRASQMLRRHLEFDRRFLRITVTDAKGATVAATHKTLDYYQADEEFWQKIYENGRGRISVTDVLYDDVTKANYIGIGVPVLEQGSNRFMGVVDALVDVSAIFPSMRRMQFGPTARMMLVREDGIVIAGPGVDLSMKMLSPEYAAVRDALQTVASRQTGYVVADMAPAETIIGFADTGLKQDYGLGWIILNAQETREAFASIRTVYRLLGFMSLIGLAAVTLLGVYVSLHRHVAYTHIAEEEREATRASGA